MSVGAVATRNHVSAPVHGASPALAGPATVLAAPAAVPRPDSYLSAGSPPATAAVVPQAPAAAAAPGEVPAQAFERLAPGVQTTVKAALGGSPTPQTKAGLEGLLGLPQFKAMDPATQAMVLETFAEAPASVPWVKSLGSLVQAAGFSGLRPEQKQQTLAVLKGLGISEVSAMVDLAKRVVSVGSPSRRVPALLDLDRSKNTLLANLHSIATAKLDPRFAQHGVSRESILSGVLKESANPGIIHQSKKGTCEATSMQYMLASHSPSEYARIVNALVVPGPGNAGAIELTKGTYLKRVPDSIPPDGTNRSPSERLFQAAVMDLCNGWDDYSNAKDRSKTQNPSDNYKGLIRSEQQVRGLSTLFARDFVTHDSVRSTPEALAAVLEKRSGQKTLASLRWSTLPGMHGNHAVVVEKVQNGRVYFRNPWGPSEFADKSAQHNPPRVIENRATGLESMNLDDFKMRVIDIEVPR